MASTTAAVHIITASAEGLGEPEILVMTRDEGMGATLIERIDRTPGPTLPDWADSLRLAGWREAGSRTEVQRGYYVVDVEKA